MELNGECGGSLTVASVWSGVVFDGFTLCLISFWGVGGSTAAVEEVVLDTEA